MNKRPFRRRGILFLAAALLLVIGLSICANVFPSRFPFLSNAFGTVFSPIQTGVSYVTGLVNKASDYLTKFDEIQAENESLKRQVADLELQLRTAEKSIQENTRLRTLLGIREAHPDFVFEPATVISRGSTNWSSTLTLNKGSASGVAVDQCIVTETGALVGIVSEVGLNWCTVTTVIHTDFEMSAQVFSSEETAVLEGNLEQMLQKRVQLSYLPDDSTLQEGDLILSSGLTGRYPTGLSVGTVEHIQKDVSGMAEYAVVVPSADLSQISHVFIIKSFHAAN